jgi:hypothetical protein
VANRISDLLNDPIIDQSLNGMLHGLQNQWLITQRAEDREALWLRAVGLQEFITTLKSLIDSGKMAATQLELLKNGNEEPTEE